MKIFGRRLNKAPTVFRTEPKIRQQKSIIDIATTIAKAVAETCKSVLK